MGIKLRKKNLKKKSIKSVFYFIKMEKIGEEDMILIDHLTEETVLENLELRFKNNLIYVKYLFLFEKRHLISFFFFVDKYW